MTKELLLRLLMFLAAIAAVVFGVLSYGFKIFLPGAMFFSVAVVFVCFGILSILERERSQLKHSKFLSITSFIIAAATIAIGIVEVVMR